MITETKPLLLVVEDEIHVLKLNACILRRRGYEVVTAATIAEAYEQLSNKKPDLLILDIMLPDGNGLEFCEAFREESDNPIIFLTGKGGISDRIDGLSRGGDYYLTKPYDPDELLAVVSRLLERHTQTKQKEKELTIIEKGPLVLNIPKARALVNGEDTNLTLKEFSLLLMLVQNEGKEISPHELYEEIWGSPSEDDIRTVRTHIRNLRKKIRVDDTSDYDIVSSYGNGYFFSTE